MIQALGTMSIGEVMPGAAAAALAGSAGINAALPDLAARLAALQAFTPTPVNFGAQLVLAQSILTSVNSSISLGLPVPSLELQIATMLELVASLLAQLASIQVQLDAIVGFQAQLSTSGVSAYAYEGPVGNLGAELAVELNTGSAGNPTAAAHALVLLTTNAATWAAIGAVMKVS